MADSWVRLMTMPIRLTAMPTYMTWTARTMDWGAVATEGSTESFSPGIAGT